MGVCFAQNDCAGCAQGRGHWCVCGGDATAPDLRTGSGFHPGDVDHVFDAQGNAMKRTSAPAVDDFLRGPGSLGACLFEFEARKRGHVRLAGGDLFDVGLKQVLGSALAGLEALLDGGDGRGRSGSEDTHRTFSRVMGEGDGGVSPRSRSRRVPTTVVMCVAVAAMAAWRCAGDPSAVRSS